MECTSALHARRGRRASNGSCLLKVSDVPTCTGSPVPPVIQSHNHVFHHGSDVAHKLTPACTVQKLLSSSRTLTHSPTHPPPNHPPKSIHLPRMKSAGTLGCTTSRSLSLTSALPGACKGKLKYTHPAARGLSSSSSQGGPPSVDVQSHTSSFVFLSCVELSLKA